MLETDIVCAAKSSYVVPFFLLLKTLLTNMNHNADQRHENI